MIILGKIKKNRVQKMEKVGLDLIVDKNLKERKQICENYNVNCITFLQLFPYSCIASINPDYLIKARKV